MTTPTPTPTVLAFADGRTFEVPTSWNKPDGHRVKALDTEGNPFAIEVYDSGAAIAWGLTDCHGSSFTGSDDGIVCRTCYDFAGGSDTPWGELTWLVGYEPPSAEAFV